MANVPEKADGGGGRPNRLIDETSPYLLQHARNPVAWYPWGPEAFEKAAREDKPIFLSVGYSSCHWCHVMAHECFEHPEVAEILNEHFVAVKVDREERPDVDAFYMLATQVLTGRGGWPNSLWLTPAGQCWYAGTYFPREDPPGGHMGFTTLLRRLGQLWTRQRKDVQQQAAQITSTLIQYADASGSPPEGPLSYALLERATRRLGESFDPKFGGFETAPKFPPHGALGLLAHESRRTGDPSLLAMLERTLEAMARGGIRDHLGGGFHRYSTDDRWFTPHFEKMLYDNAQLIGAYVDGFGLTGRPDFRQVALEACHWVLRDMTDPGGAFLSALDADSEGREGRYYLWTHQELLDVLGPRAGLEFAGVYGATPQGNFLDEASGERTGTNILHLPRSIEQAAADLGAEPEALRQRLQEARDKLLARRSQRVPPGADDKVLVGWNGLMISALARAGKEFAQPDLLAAAARAARFILDTLHRDGRLLRTFCRGQARHSACLEDYALLANALLDLHEATGKTPPLAHAVVLAETMVARYADPAGGGFFVTPDDHDDYRRLLHRIKDPFDQAVPSGNAVAARVLLRLSALTGNGYPHLDLVERTLRSFQGLMERVPNGTASLLLATGEYLRAAPLPPTHAPHPHPHAIAASGPLRAELFASERSCRPGEPVELTVAISLDPGWHIVANPASDASLAPATLTLRQTPHATLARVTYPPGQIHRPSPDAPPLLIYRDRTCIRALLVPSAALPASLLNLTLTLAAQPCGPDHCLSPVTLDLSLTLDVDSTQSS